MKIHLTADAEQDIERGIDFYENLKEDLGTYFNDCLTSDINSLMNYGGIHAKIDGRYYTFSQRFPFVIWYGIEDGRVIVYAVLDGRSEPSENEAILAARRNRNN